CRGLRSVGGVCVSRGGAACPVGARPRRPPRGLPRLIGSAVRRTITGIGSWTMISYGLRLFRQDGGHRGSVCVCGNGGVRAMQTPINGSPPFWSPVGRVPTLGG